MNKVIMYGRLTKDPEIRYTPSRNGEDMAVARFTITVDPLTRTVRRCTPIRSWWRMSSLAIARRRPRSRRMTL